MSWEPMSQEQFDKLEITLKEAMRAGEAEAAMHLGNLYYNGPSGNDENIRAALPYWQRAVDGGELSQANVVAHIYLCGPSDIRNEKEGFRYAIIAADNGHAGTQFLVGMSYINGTYCKADRALGKMYLEKAALQGHGEAQYCLSMEKRQDHEDDSLHWMVCAYVSGNTDATKALNSLIKDSRDKQMFQDWAKQIQRDGWAPQKTSSSGTSDGGCYVATCVYGSYDCPQVWTLRRFRDNTLASTWYGRAFIRTYYAVSPTLVKWFGHTDWFKNLWRGKLDTLVRMLQSEGVEDTPYTEKKW